MSDEAVQFRDAIRSLNTTLKTREAKIASLKLERDALREALKQIASLDTPQVRGLPKKRSIHDIARAALGAKPE